MERVVFILCFMWVFNIAVADKKTVSFYKCEVGDKILYSDKPCSSNGESEKKEFTRDLTEREKSQKQLSQYFESLEEGTKKIHEDQEILDEGMKIIRLGMTKETILFIFKLDSGKRYSLGYKINTTRLPGVVKEQMILSLYKSSNRKYLYFKNGILTSIQE